MKSPSLVAVAAMSFAALAGASAKPVSAQVAVKSDIAALAKLPVVDSTKLRTVISTFAGYSGKLLARFTAPAHSMQIPLLSGNLAYTSRALPQVQEITGASRLGTFSL